MNNFTDRTNLFSSISPSRSSWVATGAGISGVRYKFTVSQHDVSAELYIDWGKEAGDENERIFDQLHAKKEQIEADFGASWTGNGLMACGRVVSARALKQADIVMRSNRPPFMKR